MLIRKKTTDLSVLKSLAEYRILTISQIAALHFKKQKKGASRRMKQLLNKGLVNKKHRGYGRTRGRPENIFLLTQEGFDILRKENFLSTTISYKHIELSTTSCFDHQLLVNWFEMHVLEMEKFIPKLSVSFISSMSLGLGKREDGLPYVGDKIIDPQGMEKSFIPDGVVSITLQQQTLLFFLEVDMGTESLATPKRGPKDVREKIINYQNYFRSGKYKRYEKTWEHQLTGFRLLFLTNTQGRMVSLCQLVQEMPPSDFVWVSNQEEMFKHGLADAIWARGGRYKWLPQTILNRDLSQPSPILPLRD